MPLSVDSTDIDIPFNLDALDTAMPSSFSPEANFLGSDDFDYGTNTNGIMDFIHDSDYIHHKEAVHEPEHQVGLVPSAGSPTESFPDSSSDDSCSPRRTDSSSSSNTAMTGGDVVMAEAYQLKPEMKPEEAFEPWGQDNFINPASLDPSSDAALFNFGDGSPPTQAQFGFESEFYSPSSFHTSPAGEGSPPQTHGAFEPFSVKASPQAVQSPFPGSHKHRHDRSLSKSMATLQTRGSREVSPTSHMIFSQGSSPSAVPHHPPSPANSVGHSNQFTKGKVKGGSFWPPGLSLPAASHPPGGSVPGSLRMAANAKHGHFPLMQQPAYTAPKPQLIIMTIPPKSRVETQIPIKLTLAPMPPGIKRIHLPPHTISKPKMMTKPRPEPMPDMLELYTMLVCSSAMAVPERKERALARAATCGHPSDTVPEDVSQDEDDHPKNGGEVRICAGCMTREQKRANRKKAKKPEEEELWKKDEAKRVIVFNCMEVKEWVVPPPDLRAGQGAMLIEAPMRIACYCRHHHEKTGFQVIFTLRDFRGQVVAQAMSPSIMITDDHKTQVVSQLPGSTNNHSESSMMTASSNTAEDLDSSQPCHPFRHSHSVSDIQALKRNSSSVTFPSAISSAISTQPNSAMVTPRNLSRPASPTAMGGPLAKKRKASGSKVPNNLHMTCIETTALAGSHPSSSQQGLPAAISPYSPPNAARFPAAGGGDTMFGQVTAAGAPVSTLFPPVSTGPSTPNNSDQVMFSNANRNASLDNLSDLSMAPMYSAPASTHASRAPSPNGLRINGGLPQQQAQFSQTLYSDLPASAASHLTNQARQPPTIIHKVIPNEGPSSGGIEVTILGSGFYQGLEVMFGNFKATTTTFWGESSLVCLLPPSPYPGQVQVTLKQQNGQTFPSVPARQPATFTYQDDNENALVRHALCILANKMNGGGVDNVRDIVKAIIDANGSGNNNVSGDGYGGSNNGYKMNLETQLLEILGLLDLDDSPNQARLNLRRKTGHAMLHLSCALGLHRFTAGLLVRGANPDTPDKGGYTALHFAAMYDHPELVRRLMQHGADPTLRTKHGLTAADVARTRDVDRAIRRASRRGSTLHSRANSATSLRSLWEPPSAPVTFAELSSTDGESESEPESLEYTSGDFSSEDDLETEDCPWLSVRRASTHHAFTPLDSMPISAQLPHAEDLGGLASPTVAVAALKEQFAAQLQQFQQSVAAHLQNLSHINMPPLPDYQQYLNSAPIMQRMSSLLPNMATRPGSAGDHPPPHTKEMDSRWWNMSSLMATSAAPPPAYEDIFPQGDLDRKQVSAATAALDAEADSKCAILYDQHVETAASPPRQLPKLLQIGRKNNITKEQQDNLRRAHAENLKKLSRDRNLFFIWIPLLVVMLCVMLYGRFPGVFKALFSFLPLPGKTFIIPTNQGEVAV